ncbi:hypothetical protein D9619_000357 [Psilocybe cf. subviscida]|uniref:Uncharacterized protein n=1 Tax=Psilocybe cf. subviscida TaxID=2480587 RepID=A0A8H5BCS6_9AGAR|nr:hypothetical protein D9619_000357 [Psilocybe cf. subviscida]
MADPTLPLEIMGLIIDFYTESESEQQQPDYDDPLPQQPSKTLLACHMASRQLRECALRHICRNISVSLYDTPERLKRNQDIIFEEVNPQLGSLARFVKEVNIVTISGQDFLPVVHEDVYEDSLLIVLKGVAERIAFQKLSIHGDSLVELIWTSLPSTVHTALPLLLQLPSVSSLCLKYIEGLPALFLIANTHLGSLSISHCWEISEVLSLSASLPKLEQLTLHYMGEFPESLDLPHLRTLNLRHDDLGDPEIGWKVISRACKTLKNLAIHDDEDQDSLMDEGDLRRQLPSELNVGTLPQLQNFTYSNNRTSQNEILPTLHDVHHFLRVSRPVPNLKSITFSHSVSDKCLSHEDIISINEDTWRMLDHVLSGGQFTGLQKVHIDVELCLHGQGNRLADLSTHGPDSLVREEVVRDNILDLFGESRQLSIPFEVDATVKRL